NHNGLLNRLLNKIDHNLIDHKNKKGKSPICLAAKNDAIDSLKLLMAHKAHIYAVDNDGNNIAHIAAENGSLKTLAFLQQSQQELLRSINNNGETPFVYGAKQGKLETIKLLLNENHFINGELITTINAMKNKYYLWDNERQTYDFLVQQHNNRLIECQNIVAIAQAACNLVTENNNLSKTLSEKTFLRPYHPESLYSYYSENDLYKMTQVERNKVKNIYLERQNRELMTKNTLEQKLHTIAIEEQRKEQARINQQKQTESERIATQQGTTIAAQKAELERIAADKYAADIAAHNKRVEEEKSRVAQPIIPKEYLNYPVQENENEQSEKSENNEQQISCCICYDEDPQLLRKIPCKNTHSDHICGACLKAPSVKTCPICRGPLTK
ncbi:MAG TPA: ankyrin repeat domain-containing protein, partial [Candidatus Babeliales bacterium]|nr:ankyrin repeat domain-containing protein [Candidatus Babeliales bacterium]